MFREEGEKRNVSYLLEGLEVLKIVRIEKEEERERAPVPKSDRG